MDAVNKTACEDDANFKLAFEKKDLSYCGRIQSNDKRSQCQNDQGNNLGRYYLKMAIANRDASLCQKIVQPEARQSCSEFVKN